MPMHAEVRASVGRMTKRPRTVDLQLRRVPAELRDRLRKRAASKGTSMSRYAIDVLSEGLQRPTLDEWLDDVRAHPLGTGDARISGAELIREVRREEEAKWDRRLSSLTRRRR